jgi:hypothetical protein
MRGNHSKKTSSFVKACLAYAHITIPSLDDIFLRLRLFLLCAQVALMNEMIVQSEGFLKAAITLIPDVPATIEIYKMTTNTETQLVEYILNFTSFLLLFPGHPEHGPFYLVKGMLNAIQTYSPWQDGSVGKTKIYLGVLNLFCTYFQRKFPYHIEKIESNDELYGNEYSYMKQLSMFIETLVTEILSQLSKLGEKTDAQAKKYQGTLSLDLVNLFISSLTMNAQSATLVVKLYTLAKNTGAVDPNYLANTLAHINSLPTSWYTDIANKISSIQ